MKTNETSEVVITTRNMHEFTAQQVYDYVVDKLRKQGKASYVKGACLYRKDKTAKCPIRCAAGHLIPDQEYKESLEHQSWHSIVSHNLFPKDHVDIIAGLQIAHDSCREHEGSDFRYNLEFQLRVLCEKKNLIYTRPTNEA